eukprot:8512115-Alexandrium_andersonii.AAC.1
MTHSPHGRTGVCQHRQPLALDPEATQHLDGLLPRDPASRWSLATRPSISMVSCHQDWTAQSPCPE